MKPKAIALISGGLDSILAVKVITDQGIEVHGVTFSTPFFGPEKAIKAAKAIGLPLSVLDITEEHLQMLKSPRYGYGRHMNPCIDCHTLMINQAGKLMEKLQAHFIVTGEVMGQRPMSQGKQTLALVAKNSGYGELVLRPLSARLLPETKPEREGLVQREKLLAIQGRSRKVQMALAAHYGIREYSTPAGGCLLTDPAFSRRLKDLLRFHPDPTRRDIELLKYGRHFRFSERIKIIVGRNNDDNKALLSLVKEGDDVLHLLNHPGPTVIIPGGGDDESRALAAGLCVLYGGKEAKKVRLSSPSGTTILTAEAPDSETVARLILS
ncbi:MAG: tRNA 4-thiouridine(8) synthase ThiI [Syntrophales bacterium]|nr:tRNA 4-thiouridine(8) synthase ThiI [Syntrophales bacterium]